MQMRTLTKKYLWQDTAGEDKKRLNLEIEL